MKILHTSDWHVGKSLGKFSRLEEQETVLEEICGIIKSEEIDAVVIAGDLFDNYNPSNKSLELFYKKIKKMSCEGQIPVIAIAGNHDSPEKIEAPDPLARECGIILAGFPHSVPEEIKLESGLQVIRSAPGYMELNLPESSVPLRILFTPFANEYRLKTYLGISDEQEELRKLLRKKWGQLADKYCDNNGVNILVTHLLIASKDGIVPDEPEDEKSILAGGLEPVYSDDIPLQIQYTALGHLHRKQFVPDPRRKIMYSGSPLEYSLSETMQDKYVVIIDIEPGQEALVREIKLAAGKKIIRKKFSGIAEAEKWLKKNPDVYVEMTIVSDDFIRSSDKNRLMDIHEGIIAVIPEIDMDDSWAKAKNIDLDKDITQLFSDYFEYRQGITPNDQILELFREVVNLQD